MQGSMMHCAVRWQRSLILFVCCMLDDRNPLTQKCDTFNRRRPSALSDRRFVLGKSLGKRDCLH
jgi:hypothetical protein